jgi:hypothetical protein
MSNDLGSASRIQGRTERTALSVARGVIAVCLLVGFPLAFGLSAPSLGHAPELIAWGFLLVGAARIIWLTFSPVPRLFDLAFWIFVYVFFGLAAEAEIATHRYPLFYGGYTDSQLITTQIRIAVGVAAFVAGVGLWNRFSRGRSKPMAWDGLAISERRCQIVGIIGILAAGYEIAHLGISIFFSSRDTLGNSILNASGQVNGFQFYNAVSKSGGVFTSVLLTMPALIALVYLIASGLWRRNRVLFVILVIVNVIVNNPISNARAWTGVVAVGLLAALVNLRKRSRSTYFALGLLLSLLVSLSYLNVFRAPQSAHRATTTSTPSLDQQLSQSPDFGMFQQEVNGTIYVHNDGFTSGRQLAGAVFVFVPRSIWPSKAGSTGILDSQIVGLHGDWSSSLWTEFYIDFGYPELIIGFVLLGYLFTYLDNVFALSTSVATRVMMPMLATYSMLFIRGALQPTLGYAIPLVILLFVCLKRKPTVSLPGAVSLPEKATVGV